MTFKKLIASLALIIVYTSASSQTELWPLENSDWYYTFSDGMYINGYTHYAIDRDTVVGGKTSQIYSRELNGVFSGLPFDQLMFDYTDTFCLLAFEDSTLLKWSTEDQVFDTLMVYNGEIGTTWYRPYRGFYGPPEEQWEQCEYVGDSVRYTILAIDEVTVNGVDLLRYQIEYDLETDQESPTWFYHHQLLDLLELIYMSPYDCLNTDTPLDGGLRCYYYHTGEADSFEYKPYPHNCDHLAFTGVDELNSIAWVVYPNPLVGTELTVHGEKVYEIEEIELLDDVGRNVEGVIWNLLENKIVIRTSKLPVGVYFLQIRADNRLSMLKIVAN